MQLLDDQVKMLSAKSHQKNDLDLTEYKFKTSHFDSKKKNSQIRALNLKQMNG